MPLFCRQSTIVLPSYGMTEAMPIASPPQDFELSQRVGTSGRACGPELSIRDGLGAELPAGAVGNICVRGPPTFRGYEDPQVRNELPGLVLNFPLVWFVSCVHACTIPALSIAMARGLHARTLDDSKSKHALLASPAPRF